MARGLALAAALAVAACGGDPSGPRSILPSGACSLVSFFYSDSTWGLMLGPELSDTLVLQVRVEGATVARFEALVPQPINAQARLLDGTPVGEFDFTIVTAGEYSGVWLLELGKALWVFMPSSARGMSWAKFDPWDIEGRALVASWAGTGWEFEARVICR